VVGDRVWVHARDQGEEVVWCLAASTGEKIWNNRAAVPFVQDQILLKDGPQLVLFRRIPEATPSH
jgi:hypothetical protein